MRLHPLFRRVRDNLSSDRLPVPSERSVDAARDFVFAHNAAPAETHQDPDAQLQWLTQLLSEAEARRVQERAEAKAQEKALRARAAELTEELEGLKEQARHSQSMAAPRQRELRDAIGETGRRLEETTAAQRMAHDAVVLRFPNRAVGSHQADARTGLVGELGELDERLAAMVDRFEEQPRTIDESASNVEALITDIYRIMKTDVFAEGSFLQGDMRDAFTERKDEFTGFYRSALRHLETYGMLQQQRRDDTDWIRKNYSALLEERDACIAAISDFREMFSIMFGVLSSYADDLLEADPSSPQRAPKAPARQQSTYGQEMAEANRGPQGEANRQTEEGAPSLTWQGQSAGVSQKIERVDVQKIVGIMEALASTSMGDGPEQFFKNLIERTMLPQNMQLRALVGLKGGSRLPGDYARELVRWAIARGRFTPEGGNASLTVLGEIIKELAEECGNEDRAVLYGITKRYQL